MTEFMSKVTIESLSVTPALVSDQLHKPRRMHLVMTKLVTLSVNIKVKNDHRSKFSNLSNWKEEA